MDTLTTLREMFAVCANERRMKEADALADAIDRLAALKAEPVAFTDPKLVQAMLRELAAVVRMSAANRRQSLWTAETIEAQAAALEAQPGMVLVPREPSEAMIEAAFNAQAETAAAMKRGETRNPRAEIYRAMIDAAQGEGK